MLVDLLVDIIGFTAEKRYPAVRKAVRLFWIFFLGLLALYVSYAILAT